MCNSELFSSKRKRHGFPERHFENLRALCASVARLENRTRILTDSTDSRGFLRMYLCISVESVLIRVRSLPG